MQQEEKQPQQQQELSAKVRRQRHKRKEGKCACGTREEDGGIPPDRPQPPPYTTLPVSTYRTPHTALPLGHQSCSLSMDQIAFLAQRRLPPSTKNANRRPRPHTAVDPKLSLSPKASYRLGPETPFEAESAIPPSLSHQISSLLSRSRVLGSCGLAFFCA